MNISRKISQLMLCLTLALTAQSGFSDDTDIYDRPAGSSSNSNLNPNVLVIIDNSANWASASQHWPDGIKQGEAELNALRTVVSELTSGTNLGLMMFTEGSGTAPAGAYVRFRVRPMNITNKTALSELIGYPSGCTDGLNSLNGTPNCILKNFNSSEKVASAKTDYSAAMLEVFKYFGGYTWPDHALDDVAGANVNSSQFGTERYAGSSDAYPKFDRYAFMMADGTTPAHDANTDIDTKGTTDTADDTYFPKTPSDDPYLKKYVTPLNTANSCAKNYVILIGNGFPSTDAASTLLGPDDLLPSQGVGGDVTQLPLANLNTTTATYTKTLDITACGTYRGSPDSIPASTAVCQSKADDGTLAGLYPGYENYSCVWDNTCSASTNTTKSFPLGTSSCGLYTSQTDCETQMAVDHPGYSSYSCTAQTACSASSTNATNPIDASTACIGDNLKTSSNCIAYGALHYPGYSGFSCSDLGNTNCTDKNNKQWRIDATTEITSGYQYDMSGITSTYVEGISYSQKISATYTLTAATPTGTYSAPTNAKIRHFDEWARFLHRTDVSSAPGQQNVTTFTIDVFKDQQDFDETSLLLSAASAGGGKYFTATNEDAIANALRKIFSEIQAVNSVFASSSLPVSVNTQGTYLNQVFMGMFRPEGSAAPRWAGNLKQYKFKVINGKLQLSDKNGDAAISTTTGFVTPCADSYWSTDTGRYWDFSSALALGDCSAQTSASPSAGSTSIYSDAPDGEVVEKGGAAQRLRGVTLSGTNITTSTNYDVCGVNDPSTAHCRKLLTCDGTSNTSCTTLTDFDTSNTKVTDALSTDLIWWVRGKDMDNENGNTTTTLPYTAIIDEVRPSVHGGVIHAQPGVVDYGTVNNVNIGTIAYYGADDGVLHAVDGGQGDTEGIELWGFIAPELYGKLNRLRNNSPLLNFPSINPLTTSPAPESKDYFFDGSIGIFQRSSTVWLYSSMRRGGRAVYAFDVSDPYAPAIKWRRGCFTDDTTIGLIATTALCSDGWSDIGQTWSHPIIGYINGYTSGGLPKPVLIFGGGYDTCEDVDSTTHCGNDPTDPTVAPTPTPKGANIWFVDADTGKVLRKYPTLYSVPGDLAVLKDDAGYLTTVYAADSGGNVYRINVGTTVADGSTFSYWAPNTAASDIRIANLSEAGQARKFLSGVAVVRSPGFNAVLVGSGDREHPLVDSYACKEYSTTTGQYVTNQFYMLMDKPLPYPNPILTPADLVNVTSGTTTSATDGSVTTITNVTNNVTTTSTNGWRFNLSRCEQTVNEGIVIAGVTYFGTNSPSSGSSSCAANLGTARGYAVDYLTGNAIGSSRYGEYVGGGMPPSPVAGVVEVDGTKYPFCIGCIDPDAANSSALQGGEVIINPPSTRFRSYWYLEND